MPPDDGSSTVAKIAADLRSFADRFAVGTSLVAGGGYTANVPIAYAAALWDRQTDGSRYSKMPPRVGWGQNNLRSAVAAVCESTSTHRE